MKKEVMIKITVTDDIITLDGVNLDQLSKDAIRAAEDRAWLAGYRQAIIHCDEQVRTLDGFKGTCVSADLMYQGAARVRDGVRAMYSLYNKK